MTRFRILATASTAATFILVAIGGLVRATKSGLGCGTDWPHCAGQVLPALANRAVIIEFSHRLAAGVVVVLIAITAATAIRHHRSSPKLLWPAVAALGLVLFQALLGAVVVWLELRAESVVLHLATALTLLAVLVYLTAATRAADGHAPRGDGSLSRRAMGVAGLVFLLLLLGSYVTGRGFGDVFPDWPLMNGEVVPDLDYQPFAVHFFHRLLAAIVGLVVVAFAVAVARRDDASRSAKRLALSAALLYVVEVVIGALNVWTDLNPLAVTLHLIVGALIWGSLIGVAAASSPALAEIKAPVARRGRLADART